MLVLEKGEDERYACNSRIATGALNVAHTDPHSDPAVLRQAIETDTEGYAAPALADALAGRRPRHGVAARGGRAHDQGADPGHQPLDAGAAAHLSAGLDWKGRGPDVLLQTLAANLAKRGGTLMLGARAHALRMEGGRCTGRGGASGRAGVDVRAASVLLADGGFQGNPDWCSASSRRGRIA